MQIIDIYDQTDLGNAQNLKDALDQYGGDYFDSYEATTDSRGGVVKFYIGNTCVLEITVSGEVSYGETTINSPSGVTCFARLCVCSKGLVIFPGQVGTPYWSTPLLIAKKTNGDPVLVYLDYSLPSVTSYTNFSRYDDAYSTFYARSIAIVVFDKDTGAVHVKHYPCVFVNANLLEDPTTVIGQQLFDPVDGVMIDGVYIVPYMAAEADEPGYFTNNGQTFTGFAYNCLALRGT